MADQEMWDKVRKELATPWDWVAAGIGAAGGLGATIAVGGLDAGTSAGVGALAAVSARKAGEAALRGRKLKKRAIGLISILSGKLNQISPASLINPQGIPDLLEAVERDLNLWTQRVISDDQFDALMNEHANTFRKFP